MRSARLLKRVFDIDLEHCPQCEGEFRIIAAIGAPAGDCQDTHAPGLACALAQRSERIKISRDGSTRRPTKPSERGVFTKHRAIHRFLAR